MRKTKLVIALSLISSTALFGCSDNDGPSSSSRTYSVTAIDGYLRGAEVWLDLNSNFILDGDEPSAVSGSGGVTNLDVTGINNPSQYPVVVRAVAGQTEDEDSGIVAIGYVMSAPQGEQVVTPLSTLVHNYLQQNSTSSKQDAVQLVASQVGIEPEQVLGDFLEGEGIPKAAYAAEKLVELGVLPEEPSQLAEAAQPNSTQGTKFAVIVAGVNEAIKTVLDTVDDSQTTEQIKSELDEKPALEITDSDGDGVQDSDDWAPNDSNEWIDADNDNLGDHQQDPFVNDTDNDGYQNDVDEFPSDATRSGDDDGDGYDNLDDQYPLDATRTGDTDGDGYDNLDDQYPLDATRVGDTDGDGYDDLDDQYPLDNTRAGDSDGDNVDNLVDWAPNDREEWVDSDNDGQGDNGDLDDDNDSVLDGDDNCPLLANTDQRDTDVDGVGDVCDSDSVMMWNSGKWNQGHWQ